MKSETVVKINEVKGYENLYKVSVIVLENGAAALCLCNGITQGGLEIIADDSLEIDVELDPNISVFVKTGKIRGIHVPMDSRLGVRTGTDGDIVEVPIRYARLVQGKSETIHNTVPVKFLY